MAVVARLATPLLLLAAMAVTPVPAAARAPHQGRVRLVRGALLFRVREAGTCDSPRRHHIVTDKLRILMDARGSEYVTSHYHVNKAMKSISKFEIVLNRCRGAVTPSLCEYFTTWGWTTGLCELVPAKNVLWSPLVESISPPFKCPLEPGPYYLANGTVDPKVLDVLMSPSGLDKFIWVLEIRIFDEERVLNHCFNVTAEVRRVMRRH